MRNATAAADALGYDYLVGLEVEFHLFKLEDPKLPPVPTVR